MKAWLTKGSADLLAKFIHEQVRPDWEEAGIVAALGKARERGDAATVAVAAIRAAQVAANRTPAVIALSGPHWPTDGPVAATAKAPPRNRTCATCYLAEDQCRKRWHWDHPFESLADAKARIIKQADTIPGYVLRRHNLPPGQMDGRPIKDVELP